MSTPEAAAGGLRRTYVILAHEQPNHLRRLCEALDAPGARCVVHFDAASGPCPPLPANAAAVPDPLHVNHGGFSLTQAIVKALRTALRDGFDYVFVMTGRDYPITPDRELLEFLADHPGQSFISFYPLVPGAPLYSHVAQRYFVDERMALPGWTRPLTMNLERAGRVLLPPRRFPQGTVPFRGSAHSVLTRAAAAYVLDFLDTPDGERSLRFFRRTWGSDEMLVQTILLNSPLAGTCRYYDPDRWPTRDNAANLHYIDWDPTRENPAILDERDLEPMLASGRFFARKFDEVRSRALLDRIDALR